MKATALGFSLNEEALTFKRPVVREAGGSLEACIGVVDFLPLKGGIGWVNKDDRLVGASTPFVVAGFGAGVVPLLGMEGMATSFVDTGGCT